MFSTTSKAGYSSHNSARPALYTGFDTGEHGLEARTYSPKRTPLEENKSFPFNLTERNPSPPSHPKEPSSSSPEQHMKISQNDRSSLISQLGTCRAGLCLFWAGQRQRNCMVVGQGEWRPPSTHRRLRNSDCVQKFPPTPCPQAKEVCTVFAKQDKIKVTSP